MQPILIIHPHVDERERIAGVLQAQGYRTRSTSSISEAGAVARDSPPSLIILGETGRRQLERAIRAIKLRLGVSETQIALLGGEGLQRETMSQGCTIVQQADFLAQIKDLIDSRGARRVRHDGSEDPSSSPSINVSADDRLYTTEIRERVTLGGLSRPDLIAFIRERFGVPPLSPAMKHVVHLLDSSDSDVNEICDAIEWDEALSVRILQFANMGGYGRGQPVNSTKLAVQRIGLRQLKRVVVTLGVLDGFSHCMVPYLNLRDFWTHSFAVGLAAGDIAVAASVQGEIEFLVAGVLHDVGRLILLDYAPGSYAELLRLARESKEALHAVEARLLGIDHCEVLRVASLHWGFSEMWSECVASHHKTPEQLPNLADAQTRSALILALANGLAHQWSFGGSGDESEFILDELRDYLCIDESSIAKIREQLPSSVKRMRMLLVESKVGTRKPYTDASILQKTMCE